MSNGSDTRRFEYKDEKSSKFWEIIVSDASFTVCYGKIGTDGQTQAKEFADAATAEKQAQKLIVEKTRKGYQEVFVDQSVKETGNKSANKDDAHSVQKSPSVSDLLGAIWGGDAELVERCLEAGLDPNERTGFGKSYGKTPLHVAAEIAYEEMSGSYGEKSTHAFLKAVPILFEATEKSPWRQGRLLGADEHEKSALSIINMLLNKGADPLALDGEGLTPLEAMLKHDYRFDFGFSSKGELYLRLFEALVPESGSAPSLQGNLLRAVSKLSHERFQNGWSNLIDGGYESYLDDLYDFFVNADEARTVFSVTEQNLSQLAVSLAYIQAYEESGFEPEGSSNGGPILQEKKAIRAAWKKACTKADIFLGEPLEAVSDFCIEFCRRYPVLVDADNQSAPSSIADIFVATASETPTQRNPELMTALSSRANNAWLAVHAEATMNSSVIDNILKIEDADELREALRRNIHLSPKQINRLVGLGIDEALARNPAIPASKLNSWADDEDSSIRIGVARNGSTSKATLAKLAKDAESEVKAAAKEEMERREKSRDKAANEDRINYGEDIYSRIRRALVGDDLDEFKELAKQVTPLGAANLLTLICSIPLTAERRLSFVRPLLASCKAAKDIPIGMLVDSFISDLGRKNADEDVAATRDILLDLLNLQCSLESVSAEAQCQLYEHHRKGRQQASEVLHAMIDQGMPIKELSNYRPEKDGNSLAEKAAYYGDIELVSRLLQSTSSDIEGESNPLSVAVRRENPEMVALLLNDGAGRYASLAAIKEAILEVCHPYTGKPVGIESLPKLLTAYRNQEGNEGVTSFLFDELCGAVENGYLELVEELIRNGAPVDHREGNVTWGNLLGSFFEMNPKDKVFMALVDAGLDLNHPSAERYRADIQKILKRAKR